VQKVGFMEKWRKKGAAPSRELQLVYIFVSCCCFNLLWNFTIENFMA